MQLLFASETVGIAAESELTATGPCDWRDVVSRAMSVKTGRDFVNFVLESPAQLFEAASTPLGPDFEMVHHLIGSDESGILRGGVVDAIDRSFADIEALDMATVRSGALGAFDPEYDPYGIPQGADGSLFGTEAVVSPPAGLLKFSLQRYKELCANAVALGRYAAIVNGDHGPEALARLDLGLPSSVQAIDTLFFADIDSTVEFEGNQKSFSWLDPAVMPQVRSALQARGFSAALTQTQDTKYLTRYPHSPICLYPSSWSDAEVAADLFVTLVTISLTDYNTTGATTPFEAWHDEDGFHVRDHVNPTHAFYREIARLAEAKGFSLCAHCGRPFLSDRSRGNAAIYCSDSCNTLASKRRRETVKGLAESGVPMEEAVRLVGEPYRASVRRWYGESKPPRG